MTDHTQTLAYVFTHDDPTNPANRKGHNLTTKQYLWTLRVLARGWQEYGEAGGYVPSPRSTKLLGAGWKAIRPYITRTGLHT